MGIITTHPNKITLIFHSESTEGRKALGMVQAFEKKILAIDLAKTQLSDTQWVEVAEKLNRPLSELIDTDHPDFLKYHDSHASFNTHDWIKIIQKSPHLINKPIAIVGARYFWVNSPSQLSRWIQPDSENISKNPFPEKE